MPERVKAAREALSRFEESPSHESAMDAQMAVEDAHSYLRAWGIKVRPVDSCDCRGPAFKP